MTTMSSQLHAGSRLKTYWYAAPSSANSKALVDPSASCWYESIVMFPPMIRRIDAVPTKIVVLMELSASLRWSNAWVDTLGDDTYGNDPMGGKMWHFADEKLELCNLPKKVDVNAAAIKKYIDVRNKVWQMFPTVRSMIEDAGSLYSLMAVSKPAPVLLPANTVAVARETEAYIISEKTIGIMRDCYMDGRAINASALRDCTRCTYGKREDLSDTPNVPGSSTLGVNVPIVFMSDRPYCKSNKVFRLTSGNMPAIFNGYSVCNRCKTMPRMPRCVRIEGAHQNCSLCIDHTVNADGLCKFCITDHASSDKILRRLLGMLEDMFPHYKVRLETVTHRIDDFSRPLDFVMEASVYDDARSTWDKTLIGIELDQSSHNGYDVRDERGRALAFFAEYLSPKKGYDKVLLIRVNHKGASFAYPPEVQHLPQPSTMVRLVILRHWVIFALMNQKRLPKASLLYLFYPYQMPRYSEKTRDEACHEEGDLPTAADAGERRLAPFWKHQCTFFAYSSPLVPSARKAQPQQAAETSAAGAAMAGKQSSGNKEADWRYYLTNNEWTICNNNVGHPCRMVGQLNDALEAAGYVVFPKGLRADMEILPALVSKLSGKRRRNDDGP